MSITNNNGLNFSNPDPITDAELGNLLGLSFSPETEEKEKEEIKETKPTDSTGQDQDQNDDSSKDKDKDEDESGLNLGEKNDSDTDQDEVPFLVRTINELHTKGIITSAYEGFDDEAEVTDETFLRLLEHNFEQRSEEDLIAFVEDRSEFTKKILQYDVSSKGKDVESYVRTLLEEQNIKSLDPENEYDQEKILRQWFKKEGSSDTEIEERITDYKDNNLLEREAKRLKPKLDDAAKKIAEKKEQEQLEIQRVEDEVKEDYKKRLLTHIQKGDVSGIKLNKEEAAQMYSILTNEDVQMTMPGGKKVTMPALEAILFHHRYDQKGNLENVILATLLLTNPKKFDEQYNKKATTAVTKEFIKQHTHNNNQKAGKHEPVKESTKSVGWTLNIKENKK